MASKASTAAPTCNHVKSNGSFCGSPALANDPYCYYHRSARERTKRQLRQARRQQPLQLPNLEDSESIQIALGDVLNAILADRIDPRKAGLLLYGLQTAAANVHHVDFGVSRYDERIDEYTESEQDSLQQEIDQEIAQETTQEAAPAAAAARKAAPLPKKKPATRVTEKELWDVVGAAAKQNLQNAADEVRKQLEKNA